MNQKSYPQETFFLAELLFKNVVPQLVKNYIIYFSWSNQQKLAEICQNSHYKVRILWCIFSKKIIDLPS